MFQCDLTCAIDIAADCVLLFQMNMCTSCVGYVNDMSFTTNVPATVNPTAVHVRYCQIAYRLVARCQNQLAKCTVISVDCVYEQ